MKWFVQFYSKIKGIHFRGSRTHLDKNKLVQNWPFLLTRITLDVCACVFYSLQVFSSFQFANFEYCYGYLAQFNSFKECSYEKD